MNEITYLITEAIRERIISDDCEKLKVSAEFSDGETRSFHFDLDATKEEIVAMLNKTCFNLSSEAAQAEADRERRESEKAADETASELLGTEPEVAETNPPLDD